MSNRTPIRLATATLTAEERRTLQRRLGDVRWRAAKALGVSDLTYAELISPGGRVLPATVTRVRAWLEAGPVCPDTGMVRDE